MEVTELLELLKLYSEKQRMILTVFCTNIPICYTTMYLDFDKFPSYDWYTKIMFTLAASIVVTTFSYIQSIAFIACLYLDKKTNNDYTSLLCGLMIAPVVGIFLFFIKNMNQIDKLGITIIDVSIALFGIFIVIIFILLLIRVVNHHAQNKKEREKRENKI